MNRYLRWQGWSKKSINHGCTLTCASALSRLALRTIHGSALWLTACTAALAMDLPLQNIRLPPGFHIELVARVPSARQMTLGENNVLYIGSKIGKVYALPLDRTYRAGPLHVIADGLTLPLGVAYRNGSLYVSAVDKILRFDAIDRQLQHPPKPVIVADNFSPETHHGGKFIAFGPDGKLYVPVGAPCNICSPDPDRYAAIFRLQADGSGSEIFARGVRNTVGFDWHPTTGELWFTDNGRDMLGDDLPPDELNHAPTAGLHFGYPYCHAGSIPDPEFGAQHRCSQYVAPAQNLGAHVAALGMRFYSGKQFPPAYHHQIFIAEHGSWNRSKKVGYRISLVTLEGNKAVGYQVFASGWLQQEQAWGRPADLLILPDGSMLVADDHAGAVYRIRYGE